MHDSGLCPNSISTIVVLIPKNFRYCFSEITRNMEEKENPKLLSEEMKCRCPPRAFPHRGILHRPEVEKSLAPHHSQIPLRGLLPTMNLLLPRLPLGQYQTIISYWVCFMLRPWSLEELKELKDLQDTT